MKLLGQVIRDVRRSKYISQRQLAERIGVEYATISRIENNRIEYDRQIITRIAHALDIPTITLETIFDLLTENEMLYWANEINKSIHDPDNKRIIGKKKLMALFEDNNG